MTPISRPCCVMNTRPRDDAKYLTDSLLKFGFEVICEPLLKINYFKQVRLDLRATQALLFTSRNGLRAFVKASKRRDIPVYAVGSATAQFAESNSFTSVFSADGNVQSLVSIVKNNINTLSGPLLHIAGTSIAGNLSEDLRSFGYDVSKKIMYDSEAAKCFSTRTSELIRDGYVEDVVLLSPRTARTFAKLVNEAGLSECNVKLRIVCISQAVADAIRGQNWRDVVITRAPTLDAILEYYTHRKLPRTGDGK